jgi:hypothetical protein
MKTTRLGWIICLAALAVPMQSVSAQERGLGRYPGFGHDRQAEQATFARQVVAREQEIARCMQEAGHQYTPFPRAINPRVGERPERPAPDPNEARARGLPEAERRQYYLALFGVEDPNAEEGLWDPNSDEGGGCWGEAMRAVPSVYSVRARLAQEYTAMLRAIVQDPRVRAAEGRWARCMEARGHPFATVVELRSAADQARADGSEAAIARASEALEASRACEAEAGLRAALNEARIEHEEEFVRQNRAVLDRHLEAQRRSPRTP